MFQMFRKKAAAAPMSAPANDELDDPANAPGSPLVVSADTWPDQLIPAHGKAASAFLVQFEFHPLANVFPMIEGREFDELVASIKKDGQLEPIIVCDDMILDGRNRYKACIAAGVVPEYQIFDSSDPLVQARWVAAKNIARRHLSEAQRALAAAELSMSAGLTALEASQRLNVSVASAKRARIVLQKGDDNIIRLVRSGDLSVHAAYEKTMQRPASPAADRAMIKALDAVERALKAGNELSTDVRSRACVVAAALAALGRQRAVA